MPDPPPKQHLPADDGRGHGSITFIAQKGSDKFELLPSEWYKWGDNRNPPPDSEILDDERLYHLEYSADQYCQMIDSWFNMRGGMLGKGKMGYPITTTIEGMLMKAKAEADGEGIPKGWTLVHPGITLEENPTIWAQWDTEGNDPNPVEGTRIQFDVQWTRKGVQHIAGNPVTAAPSSPYAPPDWMMYVFPAIFLIFIGVFVWKRCSLIKKCLKRRRKRRDPRHLLKTPVAPALAHTWPRPRSRDFV